MKTPHKNPHAVSLGRKGGNARAARMTPQQRSNAARKAVMARWRRAGELHAARVAGKAAQK